MDVVTVVAEGYAHKIPRDELGQHARDGAWCACAPRLQHLPLSVADREGYAAIVHHASRAERRQLGIIR